MSIEKSTEDTLRFLKKQIPGEWVTGARYGNNFASPRLKGNEVTFSYNKIINSSPEFNEKNVRKMQSSNGYRIFVDQQAAIRAYTQLYLQPQYIKLSEILKVPSSALVLEDRKYTLVAICSMFSHSATHLQHGFNYTQHYEQLWENAVKNKDNIAFAMVATSTYNTYYRHWELLSPKRTEELSTEAYPNPDCTVPMTADLLKTFNKLREGGAFLNSSHSVTQVALATAAYLPDNYTKRQTQKFFQNKLGLPAKIGTNTAGFLSRKDALGMFGAANLDKPQLRQTDTMVREQNIGEQKVTQEEKEPTRNKCHLFAPPNTPVQPSQQVEENSIEDHQTRCAP